MCFWIKDYDTVVEDMWCKWELPQFKSFYRHLFPKVLSSWEVEKNGFPLNNWVKPSNKGEQLEWPMKGCPDLLEGMVSWLQFLRGIGWPIFPGQLWKNGSGPLYTRSQGQKNLGPTLSIFGLLFGPKLLISVRTLTSGY
jgi:hypothetical protein